MVHLSDLVSVVPTSPPSKTRAVQPVGVAHVHSPAFIRPVARSGSGSGVSDATATAHNSAEPARARSTAWLSPSSLRPRSAVHRPSEPAGSQEQPLAGVSSKWRGFTPAAASEPPPSLSTPLPINHAAPAKDRANESLSAPSSAFRGNGHSLSAPLPRASAQSAPAVPTRSLHTDHARSPQSQDQGDPERDAREDTSSPSALTSASSSRSSSRRRRLRDRPTPALPEVVLLHDINPLRSLMDALTRPPAARHSGNGPLPASTSMRSSLWSATGAGDGLKDKAASVVEHTSHGPGIAGRISEQDAPPPHPDHHGDCAAPSLPVSSSKQKPAVTVALSSAATLAALDIDADDAGAFGALATAGAARLRDGSEAGSAGSGGGGSVLYPVTKQEAAQARREAEERAAREREAAEREALAAARALEELMREGSGRDAGASARHLDPAAVAELVVASGWLRSWQGDEPSTGEESAASEVRRSMDDSASLTGTIARLAAATGSAPSDTATEPSAISGLSGLATALLGRAAHRLEAVAELGGSGSAVAKRVLRGAAGKAEEVAGPSALNALVSPPGLSSHSHNNRKPHHHQSDAVARLGQRIRALTAPQHPSSLAAVKDSLCELAAGVQAQENADRARQRQLRREHLLQGGQSAQDALAVPASAPAAISSAAGFADLEARIQWAHADAVAAERDLETQAQPIVIEHTPPSRLSAGRDEYNASTDGAIDLATSEDIPTNPLTAILSRKRQLEEWKWQLDVAASSALSGSLPSNEQTQNQRQGDQAPFVGLFSSATDFELAGKTAVTRATQPTANGDNSPAFAAAASPSKQVPPRPPPASPRQSSPTIRSLLRSAEQDAPTARGASAAAAFAPGRGKCLPSRVPQQPGAASIPPSVPGKPEINTLEAADAVRGNPFSTYDFRDTLPDDAAQAEPEDLLFGSVLLPAHALQPRAATPDRPQDAEDILSTLPSFLDHALEHTSAAQPPSAASSSPSSPSPPAPRGAPPRPLVWPAELQGEGPPRTVAPQGPRRFLPEGDPAAAPSVTLQPPAEDDRASAGAPPIRVASVPPWRSPSGAYAAIAMALSNSPSRGHSSPPPASSSIPVPPPVAPSAAGATSSRRWPTPRPGDGTAPPSPRTRAASQSTPVTQPRRRLQRDGASFRVPGVAAPPPLPRPATTRRAHLATKPSPSHAAARQPTASSSPSGSPSVQDHSGVLARATAAMAAQPCPPGDVIAAFLDSAGPSPRLNAGNGSRKARSDDHPGQRGGVAAGSVQLWSPMASQSANLASRAGGRSAGDSAPSPPAPRSAPPARSSPSSSHSPRAPTPPRLPPSSRSRSRSRAVARAAPTARQTAAAPVQSTGAKARAGRPGEAADGVTAPLADDARDSTRFKAAESASPSPRGLAGAQRLVRNGLRDGRSLTASALHPKASPLTIQSLRRGFFSDAARTVAGAADASSNGDAGTPSLLLSYFPDDDQPERAQSGSMAAEPEWVWQVSAGSAEAGMAGELPQRTSDRVLLAHAHAAASAPVPSTQYHSSARAVLDIPLVETSRPAHSRHAAALSPYAAARHSVESTAMSRASFGSASCLQPPPPPA